MNLDIKETIGSIFLETAESLTYMFGDPVDKTVIPGKGLEWSRSTIRFTGTRNGTLSLIVPSTVCGEIAANIMGVEPQELSEGASQDALKELLNVVSGHIVPSLQDGDRDFMLTVPTIDILDGVTCHGIIRDPATICFYLDGSPVVLNLDLES